MPAARSESSTRPSIDGSSLTVALPLEIWMAGASPKKFGSVYSRPNTTAIARIAYFQTG